METNAVNSAVGISAMAMRAQGERLRVIAENIANADTTGSTPEADPFRRRTITFDNVFDKEMGADVVKVGKIGQDYKSEFKLKYQPGHPAADKNGYIKTPNIDTMMEMMDMREAQRSYDANLGMIDIARNMMSRAVDLLRG